MPIAACRATAPSRAVLATTLQRAFSDGRAKAIGVFGRQGRRNSPAIVNRGYGRAFFWDARVGTLEEQVLKPIEDPNEMDLPIEDAAARVGLLPIELSQALASYVRSILSGDAPYDRFVNGDRRALSQEQQAGLRIFRGKGNCTACHVGPTFTDERTHNTGIAWAGGSAGVLDEGEAALRVKARISARSKRRRCARSRAPRPTCTTAAWRHLPTSSTITTAAATPIRCSIRRFIRCD